jgi:hypothetical protein
LADELKEEAVTLVSIYGVVVGDVAVALPAAGSAAL